MERILEKKAHNVCLCKRHKTELKRVPYEFLLNQGKLKTDDSDVQTPSGYPTPKKILSFVERHPEKRDCIDCIQLYLSLLTNARGEQIPEIYLSHQYRRCFESTNRQ